MAARKILMLEIDGRLYVATPTPVHHEIGRSAIILARRDGTEPLVVIWTHTGHVRCTCQSSLADTGGHCKHIKALAKELNVPIPAVIITQQPMTNGHVPAPARLTAPVARIVPSNGQSAPQAIPLSLPAPRK